MSFTFGDHEPLHATAPAECLQAFSGNGSGNGSSNDIPTFINGFSGNDSTLTQPLEDWSFLDFEQLQQQQQATLADEQLVVSSPNILQQVRQFDQLQQQAQAQEQQQLQQQLQQQQQTVVLRLTRGHLLWLREHIPVDILAVIDPADANAQHALQLLTQPQQPIQIQQQVQPIQQFPAPVVNELGLVATGVSSLMFANAEVDLAAAEDLEQEQEEQDEDEDEEAEGANTNNSNSNTNSSMEREVAEELERNAEQRRILAALEKPCADPDDEMLRRLVLETVKLERQTRGWQASVPRSRQPDHRNLSLVANFRSLPTYRLCHRRLLFPREGMRTGMLQPHKTKEHLAVLDLSHLHRRSYRTLWHQRKHNQQAAVEPAVEPVMVETPQHQQLRAMQKQVMQQQQYLQQQVLQGAASHGTGTAYLQTLTMRRS
eukprot:m.73917 g.73917  ORF g.73917 m.73917 type:complete len:430 (+) comp14487_c1_seq1:70-1359(+)